MKKTLSALLVAALFVLPHPVPATDSDPQLSPLPETGLSLYRLYEEHSRSGRVDEAAACARLYLEKADSSAADPVTARLAAGLADYLDTCRYAFTESVRFRELALSQYRSLRMEKETAETLFALARTHYRRGRYDKTLPYAAQAEKLFADTEDSAGYGECQNLLGAIYFTCNDLPKAETYFEKYAENSRQHRDTIHLANALNNLAAYAQAIGDTARSGLLIRESISLSKDPRVLSRSYMNQAALDMNAGRFAAAETMLSKALPMLEDPERKGTYFLNRSILFRLQGRPGEAILNLKKALESLDEGEFHREKLKCYRRLIELYRETGDTAASDRSAYEYLRTLALDNPEKTFQELFRYQNEIILGKEQEKIRQRRYITAVWLSVSFGLLCLSATVFFHLLRRKRAELLAQQLLNRQKEQEIRSMNEIIEIKRIEQFKIERLTDELSRKLGRISLGIKDQAPRKELQQLCREIEFSKDEDAWKEISTFIPEFNSVFFQKLLADFPNLSIKERRLCALLNLNLSSKEISQITRQSPHSINIARSRLRHKLGLTGQDTSIQDFLKKYN